MTRDTILQNLLTAIEDLGDASLTASPPFEDDDWYCEGNIGRHTIDLARAVLNKDQRVVLLKDTEMEQVNYDDGFLMIKGGSLGVVKETRERASGDIDHFRVEFGEHTVLFSVGDFTELLRCVDETCRRTYPQYFQQPET